MKTTMAGSLVSTIGVGIHRSGPGPTGAPGAEVPETRKNSYGAKREADMRNMHQGVIGRVQSKATVTQPKQQRKPEEDPLSEGEEPKKTARKKRHPFSLPAALCLYQGLSRNPGSPMQGEETQERQSVPKA